MVKLLKNMGAKRFLRRAYRWMYLLVKRSIYPIGIPPIEVSAALDFLLVELPPLSAPALMPNGIGYVNNILKKCGIHFQTLPLNIILYHRYHSLRILEGMDSVITQSGYVMKKDPWSFTHINEWDRPEVIEYFWPYIEEAIKGIADNRPRVVGLSVHGSNRFLAKKFVGELRTKMPEIIIVVGGYDCVYREVGPHYMVIGEAELTLEPLLKALIKGEKPKDLIGIISKHDTPAREWIKPLLPEDIDSIGFPKYEWTDLALYQTFDKDHVVPISASRGCRWGRCRFCAECFPFRKRAPQKVVDEIEFMHSQGFSKFFFNESDINGDPENLYSICSEIIRRKLAVQLSGQIRVDKRNTKEFFKHLARAGFLHLIFGVDGWSDNVLRLQRKGYNMALVFQNLRDCSNAGVLVSGNMVIGIPGETEDDINEMKRNLALCKDYIYSMGAINTLILAAGSEYYRNPDEYKIRFRGNKNEIYRNNPYFIPIDLWYSEEPYIDQEVRVRRLNGICTELYRQGSNIGPLTFNVVEKLIREQKQKTKTN